ncbi:glycerate dehydrogenase [mine drainage metagenome]|uniref:Glycerate dehydrogenase n=1 Tax=mine drainage metagenome TaxID=410659 RepID=A0A1J5RQI2_9ZZZZ
MRRLFIACALPPSVVAEFARAFAVTYAGDGPPLSADDIVAGAAGHDALVVTAPTRVDRALIGRLPASLQALATYSVGHDHLDLTAAAEKGLAVFSTPDVLTDACAEAALLLMLGAARRATEAIALLRERRWTGWTPTQLNGWDITGKRLGIVGMGRLGRAIADRARAFRMPIHYHNRSRLPADLEGGATYHPSLDALLAAAQVLVLACPGGEATRGLLNKERIARLPPGAIVVNIGRGSVVVDADLADALDSGHVAAAGLDVFDGEPALYPRYYTLPTLFMLPHIGSATLETRNAMGRLLAEGLEAFWSGGAPVNRLV